MFGRFSRPNARTWSEITSVIRLKRLLALLASLRSELSGTRCVSSRTTASARVSTSPVLNHRSSGPLAPFAPDAAVGGFELPRRLFLVHHQRILHALAQVRSQRGQRCQVICLLRCQIDVIRGNPVLEPHCAEQAAGTARDGARTGGGHHRYTHVERVARGGTAAVGRGVERDVDL